MRSIFQDTELQANQEQSKAGGSRTLPVITCIIAMVFAALVWGIYVKASNHPAPAPPPPPVSLKDADQTNKAFSTFNAFIREGKFAEAEKMLSTNAINKLKSSNKSLSESLLGKNKDAKLTVTDPTPSGEATPERVRKDHVFIFENNITTIVPLELVIENGKIVVDGWGEEIIPEPTPTPTPTPSPEKSSKASKNNSRGKRR